MARIDAQTLARPVARLAEEAQIDLPSREWGTLAHHISQFPLPTTSKGERKALILLVAALAGGVSETSTPQQFEVAPPQVDQLMSCPDVTTLVSEKTWSAWCHALKAGGTEDRLLGEVARELDIPWPSSRRSETLERYLDLTLTEIGAIPGIGQKKVRVIVLSIAQAVHGLRAGRTSTCIDENQYENVGQNHVGDVSLSLSAPRMEHLMNCPDITMLVSTPVWSAWCHTLKVGHAKNRLLGEVAGGLGLSWPSSRRSETLERYLDLTLAEIEAIPGIGQKKLRVIVLCVVQVVYELRSGKSSSCTNEYKYDNLGQGYEPKNMPGPRSTFEVVEECLRALKEKNRDVIELRFGLRTGPPQTLAEIAQQHNVTRERIRQIEVKTLRLLRSKSRLSSELRRALDEEADTIWSDLVADHEVVPAHLSDRELAGSLNPVHRLSFLISGLSVSTFLDRNAVRVARGWYRSDADRFLVERVIFQLENEVGDALPAPTHIIARRLDTDISTVRIAAAFSSEIRIYKGYVWRGHLRERGRRSIILHRILASMSDRVAVETTELISIHNRIRPHSPCSYRDAEMAMASFGHLFVQMGKGAWTAIGGVPLGPIEEVDPEDAMPSDSAVKNDITTDVDSKSVAGIIIAILEELGPLRMSEIVDHFCERTEFRPSSVGPILMTRGDFLRMAPGVYGLAQHLSDKSATEKAQHLLRTEGSCSEFIRAVRAGEPRNRFPLWTSHMEYEWCKWAKDSANADIYSSLLTVVEPSKWEQIPIYERDRWLRSKHADSCYKIDREPDVALPESILLRDLLGPVIFACRQRRIGWVSINHLHGNRQNDAKGLGYLALLIAAGVVQGERDWRLPHAARDEADTICSDLVETLLLYGRLQWDSTIGKLLKDRIGEGLSRSQGWITVEMADYIRTMLFAEERFHRTAVELLTRAIVNLGVAIASADGKPDEIELERVRSHAVASLTSIGGISSDGHLVVESFITRALETPPDTGAISAELLHQMSAVDRQSLMAHLFAIAAEDGVFHESEARFLVLLQKNLNVDPEYFETLFRSHAKDPRIASLLSGELRQRESHENIEDLVSLLTI